MPHNGTCSESPCTQNQAILSRGVFQFAPKWTKFPAFLMDAVLKYFCKDVDGYA